MSTAYHRERGEGTGHGCYSLRLLLPVDDKVKFATLRNKTEEIEIAAGLRYGAIYVECGSTAADVWLHVTEVDVLSKTIVVRSARRASGASSIRIRPPSTAPGRT